MTPAKHHRATKFAQTIFGAILFFYLVLFQASSAKTDFNSCDLFLSVEPSVTREPWEESSRALIEGVLVADETMEETTSTLRDTLTGNLATVWRSEWKSKLGVEESNLQVKQLVESLVTPTLSDAILEGLDVKSEGFVRAVHERVYHLQKAGRLHASDLLGVRDPPPPLGVRDDTFTYYTKPIKGKGLRGWKHQLRLRTYPREINLKDLEMNVPVAGFDLTGQAVKIERMGPERFQLTDSNGVRVVSHQVLLREFGNSPRIYAPHGRKHKLEVKTALPDWISEAKYPVLGGNHMVQKLDVGLSIQQVAELFMKLTGKTEDEKRLESLGRVRKLRGELLTGNAEVDNRIIAVFSVLETGVEHNPDFLQIEGATYYHRSAFESGAGFQFTVDRNQGVYFGNMYDSKGSLKTPMNVIQENSVLAATGSYARHVELKFPVWMVANFLGLKLRSPSVIPNPPPDVPPTAIDTVLRVYTLHTLDPNHPGKFQYLLRNGEPAHHP